MGTYAPPTTLLLAHVATRLGTLTTPLWRTNIGLNVSTEREQVLDTEAPLCNVRLIGWESDPDGSMVNRSCELAIEAVIPATAQNAEAQAQLAAEDVFELFRLPGAGVNLGTGIEGVLRPVDSATIERPDGAAAAVVRFTLRAMIYELL